VPERHRQPAVPDDPTGIQQPHDVLAAEEFGIGTRDERYPADPTGITQPHDVLAAEEFPMPSPVDHPDHRSAGGRRGLLPLAVLGGVAALVLLRRASR
jgi:hypothetical protein